MAWEGSLTDVPRYIYGTTRLGDASIPFEERVEIARKATETTRGFHTSHTYGDALQVLRAAYEAGATPPNAIYKIGWDSVEQVREVIRENLDSVGQPSMAIGQLCTGGPLADDIRNGGTSINALNAIKTEGLVGRYVLELWPWNSPFGIDAIRSGHADRLLDGVIFYLNPLQRFVSNELWDLLHEQKIPIIAMRTTCGGDVYRMRDSGPDYLRERAAEIIPLFEQTGLSWTEFCVRYSLGFPNVRATVGATSRAEHLQEMADAVAGFAPLPSEVQEELAKRQRSWSENHDVHKEPWSM